MEDKGSKELPCNHIILFDCEPVGFWSLIISIGDILLEHSLLDVDKSCPDKLSTVFIFVVYVDDYRRASLGLLGDVG
jgi:hypothetical protein